MQKTASTNTAPAAARWIFRWKPKAHWKSLVAIETQNHRLEKPKKPAWPSFIRPPHPTYKSRARQALRIESGQKIKSNRQISELPNIQQEVIRLTRDVDTNQATYVQLLTKQQELNIMQASAQGNVRVVDHAMTAERPHQAAQKP
jgi:tyrosine-protein kinase Etk/Wzc